MRYLFGFTCLVAVVSAPLAVSAQIGGEGHSSMPLVLAFIPEHLQRRVPGHQHKKTAANEDSKVGVEEPAPSVEPTPEEPALQLKLDDARMEVVPSPPRTPDGYTLEEMDVRVNRAKVGLVLSSLVMVAGAAAAIGGAVSSLSIEPGNDSGGDAVTITGVSLWAGGSAGMIATGILLRRRNRDRDGLLDDYFKLGLQPASPDAKPPAAKPPTRRPSHPWETRPGR